MLAQEHRLDELAYNPEIGIRYYAALFVAEVTFLDRSRITANKDRFSLYKSSSEEILSKLLDWHIRASQGEFDKADPSAYSAWLQSYDFDYRFANWQVTHDCTIAKESGAEFVSTMPFQNSERNNYCKFLRWSEFETSYWCGEYATQIIDDLCK